jgi:hypothetical protein
MNAPYSKAQSLHRNREDKPKGAGLKRTTKLEGGKPLRQVSEKRARRLQAEGLPLTTFGRPDPMKRLKQNGMRWLRSTKPWVRVRRLTASTSPKLARTLKRIGRRGKVLERLDRAWGAQIRAIWGSCIITGETGQGWLPVDPDHCYPKRPNPHLRHNPANGVLLRRDLHAEAHKDAGFRNALKKVADEALAATVGTRPPVTRLEAREIIFRMAPQIQVHARPEVSD